MQRVRFWSISEQLQLGTLSVTVFQMLDAIITWRQPSLHVPIAISQVPMAGWIPLGTVQITTHYQKRQQQVRVSVSPVPSIHFTDCGVRKSLADGLEGCKGGAGPVLPQHCWRKAS